jgi:hypothetical protein
MGSWLEWWMEGKHDGRRKEIHEEVQQARAADDRRGADDGVLGGCDSDVLAVTPLRRRAGAGLGNARPGDSMRERKTR